VRLKQNNLEKFNTVGGKTSENSARKRNLTQSIMVYANANRAGDNNKNMSAKHALIIRPRCHCVRWPVCVLGIRASCAKTAEPIVSQFEGWLMWVHPRNHVLMMAILCFSYFADLVSKYSVIHKVTVTYNFLILIYASHDVVIRYDMVYSRALNSWRAGQLNLAHSTKKCKHFSAITLSFS